MAKYEGPDCEIVIPPDLAPGETQIEPVFHDEMTISAHDDLASTYEGNGVTEAARKTLGSQVMVSDFLCESRGLLHPTQEELSRLPEEERRKVRAKWLELNSGDDTRFWSDTSARVTLQIGKNSEGYWTGADTVVQTRDVAIPMFECMFPGKTGLFVFDNSSCHGIYAPDALDAAAMRANPSDTQPVMRDGWYVDSSGARVVQSMVFQEGDVLRQNCTFPKKGHKYKAGQIVTASDEWTSKLLGVPKGGFQVAAERGLELPAVWKCTKTSAGPRAAALEQEGDEMGLLRTGFHAQPGSTDHGRCCGSVLLGQQPDFAEQKCWLEEVLHARGHLCLFLPKAHPELSPIERYWGRSKKLARYHCDHFGQGMRHRLIWALDNEEWCPLSLLRKYFRLCWRYHDAYRHGYSGALAAYAVKKAKSHRMVSPSLDAHMLGEDLEKTMRAELERREDPDLTALDEEDLFFGPEGGL
jgi:hypothetical protein